MEKKYSIRQIAMLGLLKTHYGGVHNNQSNVSRLVRKYLKYERVRRKSVTTKLVSQSEINRYNESLKKFIRVPKD